MTRTVGRAGIAAIVCLVLLLVVGTTGAVSRAATTTAAAGDPTFSCGIEQGPVWSVSDGLHGRRWYVIAIQTRTECDNAHDWAAVLGRRIAGRGGQSVQVFRVGTFGCVMVRTQLMAVCRQGNGGHGADGVIVLGNPAQNPLVEQYSGSYSPAAQQRVADLAGVPGPKGTSLCKLFDGPRWTFKAADGHAVSGGAWQAVGDSFPDGCAAAGDLRAASAAALTEAGRSDLVVQSKHGDWGCVAAHDYAWPGGAGSTVGVPVAGCARLIFPFGTDTLSGGLEQVVVIPDVSGVTPGSAANPSTGVDTAVLQQVNDMHSAASHYGVMAVAVVAAAARVTGGSHPETNAHTPQGTVQCGSRRVSGAGWRHGGAHGAAWLVATHGGYPCALASAVYAPVRAVLDTIPPSGMPAAAALHRYGWTCRGNRTTLTGVCSFDPPDDTLAIALGRAVPAGMRVAVSAAYPGGQAALASAIGG